MEDIYLDNLDRRITKLEMWMWYLASIITIQLGFTIVSP